MAAVLFSELPSGNIWPPRRRIRGGFLLARPVGPRAPSFFIFRLHGLIALGQSLAARAARD